MDTNVTRNVAGELENNDWGLMILHYLGLDHIGHKAGPRRYQPSLHYMHRSANTLSPNMVPKQREMDGIVKEIFQAIESNEHLGSTLFVICGDHGMNDAGNHGASSPGETSPALVFMSPKLQGIGPKYDSPALPKSEFDYYSTVEQSDIAPTVAALLGFPVSKNNLGAFIPEFLPFWPQSSDKVQILMRNARQILNIVTAAFGLALFDAQGLPDPCTLESTEVNELACEWRKISQQANSFVSTAEVSPAWLAATSAWLRKAQDLMSSMASNYDMSRLYLGLGLSVAAVVASAIAVISLGTQRKGSFIPLLLVLGTYGAMMFASSYVEEEQHFWYWSSTLWLAFLGVRDIRRYNTSSS